MVSKHEDDQDIDGSHDNADEERRARRLKTGIGIGIGSAAIVAALLYASKGRKKKVEPDFDD